jgi:hypothetical protein
MSTNREELSHLVSGLSEEVAAKVLDFARAQQSKENADDAKYRGHGEALLDQIAADPGLKARFNAMVDRQLEAVARGEGADGEAFMDELMAGLPE